MIVKIYNLNVYLERKNLIKHSAEQDRKRKTIYLNRVKETIMLRADIHDR